MTIPQASAGRSGVAHGRVHGRLGARIVVDGHALELARLDKVLFPGRDGEAPVTKGEFLNYYLRIAPLMLPHIAGRPVSMHRFPNGIESTGFYQKNRPDYFPDWIPTYEEARASGGSTCYAVVDSTAALVYLANQAVITPHIWMSRRDRPDHPDRMVVDLDPSDRDFGKVVAAARRFRRVLDALGLVSFPMLTGSRGIHVTVPLVPELEQDGVRRFARDLCRAVAATNPRDLTIEHRTDKRNGRVFLDWLRNSPSQTAAPPYAVRARPGAPVAMPVGWHELDADVSPDRYTVRNAFRRLGQVDDAWDGFFEAASGLDRARRALARL